MPILSIGACFSYGWATFKKRPWLFISAALVIFAVQIGLSMIALGLGYISELLGEFTGQALSFIANILVGIGITALYLKAHDDVASARIKDLWHPELFINYIVASALVGLCVLVGFILLIIPGIIVSLMLSFTLYLVVDRNLRPVEALKESRRLTRGNRGKLLLLALCVVLLNGAGLLALGVGLFITMPVSTLAFVHAYRTLSGTAPAAPSPAVSPA